MLLNDDLFGGDTEEVHKLEWGRVGAELSPRTLRKADYAALRCVPERHRFGFSFEAPDAIRDGMIRLDEVFGGSDRIELRRYRLTVRTEPSQGLNTGSIPVSATMFS